MDDSAIHEMLTKLGVSNSPHSRGVTILFKKEFSFKFINQHRSNDGRIILLNIEHDKKNITLINIYAPNTENLRSGFFKKVSKWILQYSLKEENMIFVGDLNCDSNNKRQKRKNIARYNF